MADLFILRASFENAVFNCSVTCVKPDDCLAFKPYASPDPNILHIDMAGSVCAEPHSLFKSFVTGLEPPLDPALRIRLYDPFACMVDHVQIAVRIPGGIGDLTQLNGFKRADQEPVTQEKYDCQTCYKHENPDQSKYRLSLKHMKTFSP